MILDSNLIIYAARPDYPGLQRFIATRRFGVSAVSVVEVLGYHKLSDAERVQFEVFFRAAEVLPISDAVLTQAVVLRQARKMSLGDALVAATALVFGRTLLTHNTKHFSTIPGLTVEDPIAAGDVP